ncbi:MAG TPA: hypothetical protein VL989_01070 [Candidatus Sulfotelmatobacter sp.]|nr:hypothetical protein [Candidatus Sulfotelmatobacter sp.]
MEPKNTLTLPPTITGYIDVSRMLRDISLIDDQLLQLKLRQPGATTQMPKTTYFIDKMVNANNLNLLHEDDRTNLKIFLAEIKEHSPILHMSFSSEPSPAFLEKLMTWLRKEIHPQLLLTVGLQPTIGVGCVLRTTNRYFDFSLAQDFVKKKNILLQRITQSDQTTNQGATQ